MNGYLIVLKDPRDVRGSANPEYRGLYRTPPNPSNAESTSRLTEGRALDLYTFGGLRDEIGLLSSFDDALRLHRMFSRSGRGFEILFARAIDQESEKLPKTAGFTFLGYDVACGAPFWSILLDMPLESEFKDLTSKLNTYGLFSDKSDAQSSLERLRKSGKLELDLVLFIWEVYLVQP